MARIRVGEVFNSYGDLEPEIEQYECLNFVNLVKKKTVLDHNNENLKYTLLTYYCKHHGHHEKIGETRQTKSYQIGCSFYLTIQQKTVNDERKLVIISINEQHNHERSDELFLHMPKQRHKVIKENTEYLERAFESRSNYRVLHKQINSGNEMKGVAILKDLYNAKAKIGLENEPLHQNDLANLIEEMLKIDGAVVKVCHNQDNDLDSIYFQDARMKKMFERYPDVVLFDGTYKLNNRRMPLVILLVIDSNNESQVGAFFIVRSENEQTFRFLFNEFKNENPNHDKIQVIISRADNLRFFPRD